MFETRLTGRSLYRVMSVSCSLAFLLFGYDAGVLGGVQATEPFLRAMGHPTGTYIVPMIASCYTLAAAFGSLVTSFVGSRLGRRNCIAIGNMCVVVGGSLQASAWSVPQIIVARVVCGFGIGFISSTVPIYMAEMSTEASQRGPEIAFQGATLITGVALAYWVDFGFTRLSNQVSWRVPISLQIVISLLSLSGILGLPDTPRWYYDQGKGEQGDSILARLHDLPIDDEKVQSQKDEILSIISLEHRETSKFQITTLFWDNTELRFGRRLRVVFLLQMFQQLMGINMLVYYSTIIFDHVGLSSFLSQLLAAVMNTCFALGTWLLPSTIERVGRRRLMLGGAIICTVLMLIFVIMVGLPHQNLATQWTAVAAVISFNFVFGYSWIGVIWLYGAEISPLRYRHVGGAIGAFSDWLFSFITVFAGGIAIQRVGGLIWIWQLCFCAGAIALVWFMCPETTGKSLEEIDLIFKTTNLVETDVDQIDEKVEAFAK